MKSKEIIKNEKNGIRAITTIWKKGSLLKATELCHTNTNSFLLKKSG